MTLCIRDEQMLAFEKAAMRSYEDRMMAHIREIFPQQAASKNDDELRHFVRAGTRSANQHGIQRECDCQLFLDHLMHYGPHFAELPWVKPLLMNDSLSGERKLELLCSRQLIVGS